MEQENQCSFNVAARYADESCAGDPPMEAYFRRTVTAGHDAVLMGNSFFKPLYAPIERHAHDAGFAEHTQVEFFSPGYGGAPISFWEHPDRGPEIKAALDVGGRTMLGMTYFDRDRNLEGYRNWVEYALQQNSDIDFFIGYAWLQYPLTFTAAEHEAEWEWAHDTVLHPYIDALREEFPDNNFYCIPYGRAAVELKNRLEAGELPDVAAEVDGRDAIYRDSKGHAGKILIDLASLVWLGSIYGVDLETFDYSDSYSLDLKALAAEILEGHDHKYDSR